VKLFALLLPGLIRESPDLAAQILGILYKAGKITAQEVVDFVLSFPDDAAPSALKPAASKGGV
jgi:hypothetical protein